MLPTPTQKKTPDVMRQPPTLCLSQGQSPQHPLLQQQILPLTQPPTSTQSLLKSQPHCPEAGHAGTRDRDSVSLCGKLCRTHDLITQPAECTGTGDKGGIYRLTTYGISQPQARYGQHLDSGLFKKYMAIGNLKSDCMCDNMKGLLLVYFMSDQ